MDARAERGAGGIQAAINVTPLVDVCLVLLIIFMVVTPMIKEAPDLALPETARPEKLPEDRNMRVVAVRADGRVYLDAAEVALASLGDRLREAAVGAEAKVVVRGDRTLPFGAVRAVLKAINKAGFDHAALVTLRRGEAATR